MVANYRRFGNLCGQYCGIVNTHHTIEDQHLFPVLALQGVDDPAERRRRAGLARGRHP